MITRYDTATPKHFTAIAVSKRIAKLGYVIFEAALKDACLPKGPAVYANKFRPNPDANPLNAINIIPGINPTDAIA
jgi:hypothetical protein